MGAVKHYQITITNQQPLIISDRLTSGNIIRTLPYIPGSVWRGALAAVWIEWLGAKYENEQERLDRYFGSRVRFLDCYPSNAKLVTYDQLTCKHGHGYYSLTDPKLAGGRCPNQNKESGEVCQLPLLRPDAGWMNSVATQLTTHSAIDPYRQSVKNNALVQFESVLPTSFYGEAWMDEDLVRESGLFDSCTNGSCQTALYVGKKLTSGFGLSTLTLEEVPFGMPIHMEQMDAKTLYVYVQSDLLLYNEYLETTNILDLRRDILQVFRPDYDWSTVEFSLLHAWRKTHWRSSWNGMWRKPQQEVNTVVPGSVYVFSLPQVEQFDWEIFIDAIHQAARRGVGWRTSEGFGTVKFSFAPLPNYSPKSDATQENPELKASPTEDALYLEASAELWNEVASTSGKFPANSWMYRIRDLMASSPIGLLMQDKQAWANTLLGRTTVSEEKKIFIKALQRAVERLHEAIPTDLETVIRNFAPYMLGEYHWMMQAEKGKEISRNE